MSAVGSLRRRSSSSARSARPTAASAGAALGSTAEPAIRPRSTGSAWTRDAGVSASAAGAGSASCCSSWSANWRSSFSATSVMTPPPNCAILPVTDRSVDSWTAVAASPSGVMVAVTVASTVPGPRVSLPLARSTAVRAASSSETIETTVRYDAVTGPTFTRITACRPSSSLDSTVTPGMAGATRSRSVSSAQESCSGRAIVKPVSMSIDNSIHSC
jgi:hypothetical protein